MSLKDLLAKSKASHTNQPEIKSTESTVAIRPPEKVVEKKKPKLKLNFGGTQTGRAVVKEPAIEEPSDPFAGLADALGGIDLATDTPNQKLTELGEPVTMNGEPLINQKPETQFSQPTLSDISKFVFEEQPDQSTQEIADDFSSMLDELSLSVGDQIPTNLARCLEFMKENDFLADILKPENTQTLVRSIRKSYGFVVATQTEKGKKKKETAQKVNKVLDNLAGFSI